MISSRDITAEQLLKHHHLGKQLVFVTNNSTKSREDYKKKFDKMGIPCKVVGTLEAIQRRARV